MHATAPELTANLGLSWDLQSADKSGRFLKTWHHSVGYDQMVNPSMLRGSLRLAGKTKLRDKNGQEHEHLAVFILGPGAGTYDLGGSASYVEIQMPYPDMNINRITAMMWVNFKNIAGTIVLMVRTDHLCILVS